jgi:V8-like Glu-specific endopeptidase
MPKKIYSIALVTVVCATFALAVQTPIEWVKVDSTEGRFTAVMPSKPDKGVREVDTAVGKLQLYTFGSSNNTGQFMLSYADYPSEATTATQQEAVLDGVRGGVLKGLQADLISETRVTIKGYPGRELRATKMTEDTEVVFSWKMFLVGRRLYQMGVVTVKADAGSPDIQKFFMSFQLSN